MTSPERIQRFKHAVEALNAQFLRFAKEEIEAKSTKLLTAGVADYLRHAASLRLQFSDVLMDGQLFPSLTCVS